MQVGLAQCVNKGMQRDYSMDKASQEFAYENRNIRITTTGNESFLSVTNERSTIELHSSNIICVITNKYTGGEYNELQITHNIPDNKEVTLKITTENKDEGEKLTEYFTINNKNRARDNYYTYNTILKVESEDEDYSVIIERINLDEYNHDFSFSIQGTVLGSALIGDALIIFTKKYTTDYIYKCVINNNSNTYSLQILYEGDLKFNINNPIECIISYEGEDVQKVYWVDGINQPRYINIKVDERYPTNETFTFVPIINNNLKVNIEKQNDGSGKFESGVIQYYITGYKKFGAESNALYSSPLYYVSPSNRGGKPNETQTCSFKINISVNEMNVDHLRIYSVYRTSENITSVKIVQDVNVNEFESKELNVIDTNSGIPVAPTEVLFLGGNTVIAGTIGQKDSTLFLGDIEIKSSVLSDNDDPISKYLTENNVSLEFGLKALPILRQGNTNAYYPYKPNMDNSSEFTTTFKYLEWYRFGIQFQIDTLEWTPTYFLKDIQNTINPNSIAPDDDSIAPSNKTENAPEIKCFKYPYSEDENNKYDIKYLTSIYCELKGELIEKLRENKIIGWRLMFAQHDEGTRTIKAQGLVLPTQFNLKDRDTETCYSTPIWTLGQCLHGFHYVNIDSDNQLTNKEINLTSQINYNKKLTYSILPINAYFNETATSDKSENNAFLLDNLFCTKEYYESSDNHYISITPIITIDRLYTWNDEYLKWGCYAGDVFYAELKIKVFIDGKISEAFIAKNSGATNADLAITYVKKPYGDRHDGCDELSSKLKGLLWSDIGDYNILGTNIKVKNLSNYVASNKLFLAGEIPSGPEIRDWVTPSSEIKKELGEFARDFTFTLVEGLLNNYKNNFFIDANLCNFISPDIDNVKDNMSFRIVGSVDATNVISDYNITVEDNVVDNSYYEAADWTFHNYKYKTENNEILTGIHSYPLWPYNSRLYYINYWNQSGSIIGEEDKLKLKTKKFANMWYLDANNWFNSSDVLDYSKTYVLQNCKDAIITIDSHVYKSEYENLLFPQLGITNTKLSDNGDPINETYPLSKIDETILNGNSFEGFEKKDTISIKSKASNHIAFRLPNSYKGSMEVLPNYSKYNLANCDIFGNTNSSNYVPNILGASRVNTIEDLYVEGISEILNKRIFGVLTIEEGVASLLVSNSDIKFIFKYNDYSSITSKNTTIEEFKLVPNFILLLSDYGIIINSVTVINPSRFYELQFTIVELSEFKCVCNTIPGYFKDNEFINSSGIPLLNHSKKINTDSKLFIGEFYVPYNESTFMGGNNQNARELNTYIPISGVYNTSNEDGWNGFGLEGDTFYQRWDHVRISPINNSDVNQPLDAVSVMLETHTNLNGDYRDLRGRLNVTTLNAENTNGLINKVYSQSNNYITSTVLDEKFTSKYSTMYMWTAPKQPMMDIDAWTQIRASNAGILDGDKGSFTKIINWNDKLLAFQEKGIALINYNNQTTISQNEGVPVEIANSGAVTGHYYISTSQGCKNKWSLVESPHGLYFIDSYNKSINVFNGDGIKSLSTLNLFEDWIVKNENGTIWKPSNDNDGFKSFYDPIHKEVYFVNDKEALCYNELLNQFTSFYDYDNLNTMAIMNGCIYGIKDSIIHKMFEGEDYCSLFNKEVPYSITYKINKDPFVDKTWTNIEYRADIFDSGNINDLPNKTLETFDKIKVWNEYQYGELNMSKAKPKFRIWRADIPRDTKEGRGLNRIRNPWIMLQLIKEDSSKRMEFHDLLIKYLQ